MLWIINYMVNLVEEINKKGYTIIGRYGCFFFEAAINICKQSLLLGRLLQQNVVCLHETTYENEINKLKGQLPGTEIQLHETYESPCIFYEGRYLGSLDNFILHIREQYGMEMSQPIHDMIPLAEGRKSRAMNSSKSDFVRISLIMDNDEWKVPHHLTIEIFPQILPKSCNRFCMLGKGWVDSEENPGYIGSKIVRVQKDSFVQMGQVPGIKSKYGYLEDEGFKVKHDSPGVVGFVGENSRHTNLSQFYITLSKLEEFDKKYCAFGRVIEGFDLLKRVNDDQSIMDIAPTTGLTITGIHFYNKTAPGEYVRKLESKAAMKKDLKPDLEFASPSDLEAFAKNHNKSDFANGPSSIKLCGFGSNDSFTPLQKISLFNVNSLHFVNCDISNESFMHIHRKMHLLQKVINWQFEDCLLSTSDLSQIFSARGSLPPRGIRISSIDNLNEQIKFISESPKCDGLKILRICGGNLDEESIEALKNAPFISKLEALELSRISLLTEVIGNFFADISFPNLKSLYLRNSHLPAYVVKEITNNKSLTSLNILDLSHNHFIEKELINLRHSKIITNLTELYLRNVGLTYDTLIEIVSSPNFSNMKRFDIGLNYMLKDEITVILLDEPFIRYLTHLNLENCDLTNESLKVLSENRHLGYLKVIDVSNNPNLDIRGLFEELEDIKLFTKLENIYIRGTGTSDEDIKQLNEEFGIHLVNQLENPTKIENLQDHLQQHIIPDPSENGDANEEEVAP